MSTGNLRPAPGTASPFRVSDYIDFKNPAEVAGLLSACLEDSPDSFLVGLYDTVEAYGGFSAVAKKTGLNREHLYRMLSHKGNPSLQSLLQLAAALGFKLTLQPA